MAGRSCYFFADEDDLLVLLKAFRDVGDYQYIQIRSMLNEENLVFRDPVDLLPLAVVTERNPTRTHSFLVQDETQEVVTEEIALRDGSGIRTIVGQALNPNSITLAFGGDAGSNTLIMSDVATSGETVRALEIHKAFKKAVFANSKRVGAKRKPIRLMQGALQKLVLGWRLASGKDWSRDTDADIPKREITKLRRLVEMGWDRHH